MKITVLIPVSNDLRILNCLKSIDEKVEIMISLNKPSTELLRLIKDIKAGTYPELCNLQINTCQIDYLSIAGAYNQGIKEAKYDNILLMDSDCTFEKGTIRKLYNNYQSNLLSKGQVVFNRSNWISGVIARAREFHTSDKISAYSPPLLFNKKIIKYIGKHYFHPNLCWLEDSEFDNRVQKADLKISYDSTAVVYHPELTLLKDLRSAFWYGVGKNIGVKFGIHKKPTGVFGSINKYLKEGKKAKGLASGLYLVLWKMTLLLGYFTQDKFTIRPTIDKTLLNKTN